MPKDLFESSAPTDGKDLFSPQGLRDGVSETQRKLTQFARSPEYQEVINTLYRREPSVDYRTGAPGGFRMEFSQMDTDPERAMFLDQRLGEGNWRKDKYGAYVINKDAAKKLGVDTDKDIALDEQSVTLRDVADWGGDLPAVAGGVLGSIATGGSGLLAGLLGAGGGALMGKSAQEATEAARNMNLQSPTEVGVDILGEGVMGAAGEGVGRGLSAIGRKILAPESARFTQGRKDLLERTQAQGFQPNFTQITDPPLAGRMARITERIFGDPNLPQNVRTAKGKIDEFRRAFGTPIDSASTGQTVKSSIRNQVESFRNTASSKYGQVDQIFEGSAVVPTQRLKQQAADILEGLPKDADGKPVFTSPELQQFVDQSMALPDNVTTRQMQAIRSRLHDAGYDPSLIPGLTGRDARRMARAAGTSFDDILDNPSLTGMDERVRQQGVNALKDAQRYYRENIIKFDDELVNRITREPGKAGSIDPELVTDVIFKKKGASRINRVKRAMAPEDWSAVQSTAMNDFMDSLITRTDDPLVTILDGKKLHNALDAYGDESLKSMFGASQVKNMREFADALMTVSKKSKDQGGLVAAGIAAKPLNNLGRLAQFVVLNKFMFSPNGLKYFTEGIKAPKTRAGAAALNRVSTMLTALAEDETGSPFISVAPTE